MDQSFTLKLLNTLTKLTINSQSDECYQELLDTFVMVNNLKYCLLVIKQPFNGINKGESVYSIFVSTGHKETKPEKIIEEIVCSNSSLLKTLQKKKVGTVSIDEDVYLKNIISKNLSANIKINKILGVSLEKNNHPIAFVLAEDIKKDIFNSDYGEIFRRVLLLSYDILLSLYSEKNKIQNIFIEIASKLEQTSKKQREDPVDVLQIVLDYTRDYLEAKKCALFLVDSTEKSLVLERASGDIHFEKLKDIATYPISEYNLDEKNTGVTPWVLFRRKSFNAKNFNELREKSEGHWKGNWDDSMYGGIERAKNDFQCVYMVPLKAGTEGIGVLKYENRTSEKPFFDQSDERIIDLIGELVTNIIVSQRIEQNKYNKVLPKISSTLITHFGQINLYDELLEKCRDILKAQICSLFLVEKDQSLTLKAIMGVEQSIKDQLKNFSYPDYKNAKGLTPWILCREQSLNVRNFPDLKGLSADNHIGKWDKIVYHDKPKDEFKSLYSIPLIIGKEPIGVFKIENKLEPPFYFTESDERLFDLIGRLIVVGVKYDNEEYLGRVFRAAEMGFLASGIAHEFGNYLQGFMGITNNMENKVNHPDTIRSKINQMKSEIDKASKTIDNFRQIRDRQSEISEISIHTLITELLSLSKKRFEDYGIDLIYEKPDIDNVKIDQSDLQMILNNLLSNAFDATIKAEQKKKIIKIIVKKGNTPNSICIEIMDSGLGITSEDEPHLFMPFYSTKGPRGMGMGLYWVHRAVEKNQGHIVVAEKNNEYGGATFRTTLKINLKAVGGGNE